MIDKNLSLDEALAENDKFLADNPSVSNCEPSLPFFQWAALHQLNEHKRLFEEGGQYSLMTAIRICANHDLLLPDWVSKAYIKAYDTVTNAKAKSWNTVFGMPYPKGTHLSAVRKKRMLKFKVWNDIKLIIKMNPETAIDESLFERVGKDNALGKTLAGEYYYEVVKIHGF